MVILAISVEHRTINCHMTLLVKKYKPRESDMLPIRRDAPLGWSVLNLGVCGNIADVITHAKFCDNRFRGFGVSIPRILPFSTGITGRLYNSVRTSMLHCEKVVWFESYYPDTHTHTDTCIHNTHTRYTHHATEWSAWTIKDVGNYI